MSRLAQRAKSSSYHSCKWKLSNPFSYFKVIKNKIYLTDFEDISAKRYRA